MVSFISGPFLTEVKGFDRMELPAFKQGMKSEVEVYLQVKVRNSLISLDRSDVLSAEKRRSTICRGESFIEIGIPEIIMSLSWTGLLIWRLDFNVSISFERCDLSRERERERKRERERERERERDRDRGRGRDRDKDRDRDRDRDKDRDRDRDRE